MISRPPAHALSFDIEDWFHVLGIPELEDQSTWPSRPSIVERSTDEILRICADAGVTATFFILGWVADRYPGLVERIAGQGHEIGTHSYAHRLVTGQTPAEFEDDLTMSIAAIEQAAGRKVTGYRAPSFSIRPGTEWALDILADHDIAYDASLYPARRMNGGYSVDPSVHRFRLESGRSMTVLPMSVLSVGPFATGFSGGGYLRLFPMRLIRWGIARNEAQGRPSVVYLHPRDLAPDAPRAPMPLHRRFMTYVGVRGAKSKLETLLREHRWTTCGEVVRRQLRG